MATMQTMKVGAGGDYEDAALERQIAMSQILRKKALETGGQMVGGGGGDSPQWYVGKSPWMNLAEGALGGFNERMAVNQQGDLQSARQRQEQEWLATMPGATVERQRELAGPMEDGSAMAPVTEQVAKDPRQLEQEMYQFGTNAPNTQLGQAMRGQVLTQALGSPQRQAERAERAEVARQAALQKSLDAMTAAEKNRDVKAPTIKQTSVANDMVQDQQFDPAAKQWVNIGVPYHRFAKQLPTIVNNGGTANDLDPDAIDFMAKQALLGDTSVLTGLARTKGALAKVRNRMATMAKEEGVSPEEAMLRGAEYQGTKAGQRLLGTRGTGIELAANEAAKMITLVRDSATKMNAGDYPSLNAIENAVSKGVGGTQVVELNARLNGLINTYARAISPSGVPTVSDKMHAREVINNAMSKGQLNVALDAMQQEMDAAKGGVRETKVSLRNKGGALPKATGSLVSQIPGESPAPAAGNTLKFNSATGRVE